MRLHKFLALIAVVTVLALAALVWLFPSDDDFRTENPFWNGSKDLSTDSIRPLKSLAALPGLKPDSALVLIPYTPSSSDELAELERFVNDGGTLLLADDFGYGNQVLEYLDLRARFAGQPLLDPLVNYRNKWFPRVTLAAPNGEAETLVFNHATSLIGVATDEVLAQSSSFSFLDLNGNAKPDKDEPVGPLPTISHHSLGKGQVILVADPSIFINSMKALENNYSLIKNVAALTGTGVFIDQSHLPSSNLHLTKDFLAGVRGVLTIPLVYLGLLVVTVAVTLIPVWRERKGI